MILGMTQLSSEKPERFNGRHFNHLLIIQAVRWYITYKLSYRNECDLMAERGVTVVHKRAVRYIGDHSSGSHDPASMGSRACRVRRSRNRLSLPSFENCTRTLLYLHYRAHGEHSKKITESNA